MNDLICRDSVFPPKFDGAAALARVQGDRELLRHMADVFGIQWQGLCVEIAKACRRRDGASLQIGANKLMQSARSFAAHDASKIAEELEARGQKSDFHDAERTCARLEMEIERLVNALKEFASEAKT